MTCDPYLRRKERLSMSLYLAHPDHVQHLRAGILRKHDPLFTMHPLPSRRSSSSPRNTSIEHGQNRHSPRTHRPSTHNPSVHIKRNIIFQFSWTVKERFYCTQNTSFRSSIISLIRSSMNSNPNGRKRTMIRASS